MTDEVTDVVHVETQALVQSDPLPALENTEKLVRYMSEKCTGPRFISNIQGRSYPRVEWWTTVGLALGLQPVEVSSKKIEFEGGYMYEAVVEVRRNGEVITRASAICSTQERSWGNRDEYAVKSMAGTRATGKAYRIGLSALAVMAGLEPTPADEVPPQGFGNSTDEGFGYCEEHKAAYFKRGKMRSPAHKYMENGEEKWHNKPADTPEPPVERKAPAWMTPEYHEASDVLSRLYDDGDQRMAYVIDAIGREVRHPEEVTAAEWVRVKESATDDLAAMETPAEDTEQLDF